ncbi:MAG: hypothetical protein GKC04_08270, partial [Methanomicrobiales archaeon]|nr:hypothetical protein [Methanomicrobiales archaeon]
AAGYVLLSAGAVMLAIGAFCTKCPEQGSACAHGVPGVLAERFLPRRTGPYSAWDYAAAAVGVLVTILLPQAWLIAQLALLVLFWVLVVMAALAIGCRVCPGCGNAGCPLARR